MAEGGARMAKEDSLQLYPTQYSDKRNLGD